MDEDPKTVAIEPAAKPKGKPRGRAGRTNVEVYEEQLHFCNEAMVRLRSSHLVERECVRKYKVHERTVRTWMRTIRKRNAVVLTPELREEKRGALRESYELVARLAMGRTAVVKDDDGKVVLDDREFVYDATGQKHPNPSWRQPVLKANPDLHKFMHAMRELAWLDSLNEPTKQEIKLETDVKLPNLHEAGPEVARAIADFMAKLGLDGAGGDAFKMAGVEPVARLTKATAAPAPGVEPPKT